MANVSQTGGSILDKMVDVIIPPQIVGFLNTTLVRYPFFILNYWSFVHLFAGVIFYLLFPKKFKLWIGINIVFEIAEYTLGIGGNPLFEEEAVDIFWDIVWSLGGFLIAKYIKDKYPKLYSSMIHKYYILYILR